RRLAAVDTEIGGVEIPAGARVVMLFGSANHDPAKFADPDVFDVERDNAGEHLSFGKGVHFCLGAPLARLELRIVLETLLELCPEIALVPDQSFSYAENGLFRSIDRLLAVPRPDTTAG